VKIHNYRLKYFKYLEDLPKLYNICIEEIKRRRYWGDTYVKKN